MEIIQQVEALEALTKEQAKAIASLQDSIKRIQARLSLMPGVYLNDGEEFDALKLLLESSSWPNAVDEALICNNESEQDKEDRAEGILDIVIDVHLEKLKFLDFGCGEGHVVNRAVAQNPSVAVGYDVKAYEQWESREKSDKVLYTTSWDDVAQRGPYNIVLLYDVIDHITGHGQAVENLKKIRSVLTPNAKIFVRCHPWPARHSTHLYHKINKAFIHLVFSDDELKEMGYEGQPTVPVIHPLVHYGDLFRNAGLKLRRKEVLTTMPVESFFVNTPVVAARIKRNWKTSMDLDLRNGKTFPTYQLQTQFIDYVLGE